MSQYDWTEHRMPSGAICYYRDRDHSYYARIGPKKKSEPDGEWAGSERLTGVTTCVAPFSWEPNHLMRWAVKINLTGVALLADDDLDACDAASLQTDRADPDIYLGWLRDVDQIKERLRNASLTDEDARDQAGDVGTAVHLHTLNALAAGEPVPAMEKLAPAEVGHGLGVTKFWLDHSPETMQAEQVICDLGLRIAGRFDFRGRLGHRCDFKGCACQAIDLNSIVMMDLKTGNYIGAPAHVQVAGYDHGARVCGFGGSDANCILHTRDDGTYRLIRGHATRADFLTAVEVYRREAAIEKAANKDRKIREAA